MSFFSSDPANGLFGLTLVDTRYERCQLFLQTLIILKYIDIDIRAGTMFL